MAYTDIDKPGDYFNTVLYTGNGSTKNVNGVNFKPDLVWTKHRDGAQDHNLFDAVRGVTKYIESNTSDAEATDVNRLTSFNTDGFTLGNEAVVNGNGNLYVSWNWLASNTTASNTVGDIASTVSANTTSGFSIVSYTGTGAVGTIGHGLGKAPQVIIWKNRDATGSWLVWHHSLPLSSSEYQVGFLNLTNGFAPLGTYNLMNATAPTSSVFTTDAVPEGNGSGNNIIAYCFAEKKGFSKFGSYTGNGSTDGTFVYTGFKPAWVLTKRTNASAQWQILDNKRDTYNPAITALFPDSTDPDTTSYNTDFLSNGFKHRTTTVSRNGSGDTYIYMAFAESPFTTSTGIAGTAR